jgi:hypothetical protein
MTKKQDEHIMLKKTQCKRVLLPPDSNLTISNEKVINFYKKNTNIDINKINLLFIELLENVSNISLDNPSIVKDIIYSLQTQSKDIMNLVSLVTLSSEISKNEIQNLKSIYTSANDNIKSDIEHIKVLLSNMTQSLISKIYETKEHYITEMKQSLRSQETDNILNISSTLERHSLILSDKVQLIINDILPKSQTVYINDIIQKFKEETAELLSNNTSKITLDNISLILETKSNFMINNIQDQLLKYIMTTEDRITSNLNNLKDVSVKTSNQQEKMNEELTIYLTKYKTSTGKGILGENILYNILCENYPSSEIIKTTGQKEMGDIILKRKDKKMILLENKNYNNNVNKEEVEKFLRDVSLNNSNGIMLSQQSGIVGKENFQIDIHDTNILIYIHNVNNDFYKINLAVNIIDILSNKLTTLTDNTTQISKEILDEINNEFQKLVIHKEKLITSFKDFYKRHLEELTEITLPTLDLFLSNFYANHKKNIITCVICKKYETDNLRSMARHKSSCKTKSNNIKSEEKE